MTNCQEQLFTLWKLERKVHSHTTMIVPICTRYCERSAIAPESKGKKLSSSLLRTTGSLLSAVSFFHSAQAF